MKNSIDITQLFLTEHPSFDCDEVVLVVDDDPDMSDIIESILKDVECKVICVNSGEAALAILNKQSVSLVLLDIVMTGLNGYQTAQRIRAQKCFSDLPILFLTATYNTEDYISMGFSLGAQDYLLKPIDPVMLCNKVKIFLRLYRQQQLLVRELEHRTQTENALHLVSIVFEHSPDGVMITDNKAVIQAVNHAFERTTGYKAIEAIGQTPNLLHSGRHKKNFYQQLWQTLNNTGQWQGEIWNRRKDGRIYPEWLNIVAVRNKHTQIVNYVGIFSDMSGQHHLRESLHQFAFYDPLTNLPNRLMLFDRLRLAIVHARRKNTELALLLLDIDRLRRINDTFGHEYGDALILEITKRLQIGLKETDTFARLDGDVFALVMTDLKKSEDRAARLAQKILFNITQPVIASGLEFHVSASIGISIYSVDGETAEELLKHADTALHKAKEAGGNNYRYYTPIMSFRSQERMELENDLRNAIEKQELTLVYQPKISLVDGRLTGVEVLTRWRHPQLGHIPPGRFIPVAEEIGLISSLGIWVLNNACHQAMMWQSKLGYSVKVAVNVSAQQFQEGGLEKVVYQCLNNSGLAAENLELELTESMLMEAANDTISTLLQLNEIGVQLSIDDFGTGYSSLSYLKRFAIHKIKIDRSFVIGIPDDQDDAAIVEAIIAMAHKLNLKVVAEGVENNMQLDFLRKVQCDEIQGYLYCPPLEADEIKNYFKNHLISNGSILNNKINHGK